MKLYPITENHLYVKTFSKGRKAGTGRLTVFVLRDFKAEKLRRANPEKTYLNRVGLSVGKRNGNAVTRNRAKRLLRFTDDTVETIGAAVGVPDPNYFARLFRRVEGLSPRAFRDRWRE